MKAIWTAVLGLGMAAGGLGTAMGIARLAPDEAPETSEATPCVAGVARLGFMAGDWSHTDDSGVWEERWSAPLSGCIVGSLRWVREGEPRMYEMLAIEEDEQGHVRMFVRHFHKGLKPWEKEAGVEARTPTWVLTHVEKGRAVFEDPSIGFPAKMTYEAIGGMGGAGEGNGGNGLAPDSLKVTLEGQENGAVRHVVFQFSRVAPEPLLIEDAP